MVAALVTLGPVIGLAGESQRRPDARREAELERKIEDALREIRRFRKEQADLRAEKKAREDETQVGSVGGAARAGVDDTNVEDSYADSETGRSSDGGTPSAAGTGGVTVTPPWDGIRVDKPRAFRGVYDKPFLFNIWQRTRVGGYTEIDYHSFEDGIQGIPEGFRMHRTNLFLYTDLHNTVQFASELEFETEFDGMENSNDIEVALEMAFVDWTLWEEFTIRGGVILPPLGRVNVNHDGPTREFAERPLVSTYVIPSTLSEPGVGAQGRFDLADIIGGDAAVEYEVYGVNGFSVLDADGNLAVGATETEQLLRESRSALGGDNNDGLATTGRVALELFEAVECGGSWHVGTYDERGDNLLKIFAGDIAATWSIFEVQGEVAIADFDRDAFANGSGVPDRFWGWNVQCGAGGMPESLRTALPNVFGAPGARIGCAVRFDWVDLNGDRGTIIEPGFTFRPFADTVFKFSYRFAPNSFGTRGVSGTEEWKDEGFVFSISTYF